jgi:CopG family nickel-responsive transcriptional regulator
VSVLKGPGEEVRHFAEHIIAERGVRHGRIFTMPAPHPHKHR